MGKQVVLKVYGRVQGVVFRNSTKSKADELGLAGWVKNEDDGTVKIVAEGEENNLEKLIEWCKAGGSRFAKVEKVDVEWLTHSGEFNNFVIKY